MPFIYKITNTVNDKVYVGKTTVSVEQRWKWHMREANKKNRPFKSKLYPAMTKYGRDKFSIHIIEECDFKDIDERERYWIAKLDSFRNGYNMTTGGDGHGAIDEIDTDRILALWEEGKMQSEINKITGRYVKAIKRILYDNGITKEEIAARQREYYRKIFSKPVYAYDMNGCFIAEYTSTEEASKATGVHPSTIGHIVHGRDESAKGFVFRDFKCEKIAFERTVFPVKQKVFQYDLDGTYLASYSSMLEAARAVGANDAHTISNSCKNQKSVGAGYQWRFFKADRIEPANITDGRHIAGGGRGKRLPSLTTQHHHQ